MSGLGRLRWYRSRASASQAEQRYTMRVPNHRQLRTSPLLHDRKRYRLHVVAVAMRTAARRSRIHETPHDPHVMVIVSPERLPARSSVSSQSGQWSLFTMRSERCPPRVLTVKGSPPVTMAAPAAFSPPGNSISTVTTVVPSTSRGIRRRTRWSRESPETRNR